MIDENEFFRNATLRICSSLNPDKALRELLEYIHKTIPVRGMDLGWVETEKGILHFLSWVSIKNDKRPYPHIILPKEVREIVKHQWENQKVTVLNDLGKLNEKRILNSIWPCNSLMTIKLDLDGQRFGGMTLWMDQKNGFTEERVNLISLLHDPVATAMSNIMKHREINSLKEVLAEDNQYLREQLIQISGDEVIGAKFGLKQVMEMVQQVASLDSPVLLLGETGVGKEIIANVIHTSSQRKNKPFIKVNCGAIPETLIDSELFGYEKGAFTGALTQKRGKFELANTGTIFLDEIGELSPPAQVRLLRVLQEKEIERVGGAAAIPIDTRIICATHRNIFNLIEKGFFREDLWFRLNVFPINIPPLRHRSQDIPALVNHFVKKKTTEMKIRKQPAIASDAMEALSRYRWPGNVRELENLVERSLIVNSSKKDSDFLILDDVDELFHNTSDTLGTQNKVLSFDLAMKHHIRKALKITGGKIEGENGAAQLLKLNPNTLRSKMRKMGISRK